MDTLRLEGSDREIDLYAWLTNRAKGHEALAGILGFGLPRVDNFWFEGAGSGSTWRGARVGRREVKIPLKVYAANRSELNVLLSDMARILDPFRVAPNRRVPARLYFGMPDDNEWYIDVVRADGGDWSRKVDSDDRTYFRTVLILETGDAFWTRNDPEEFRVVNDDGGDTLLPYMAKLQVSSAAAFGIQNVSNVGDTFAWPIFTIEGPTTRIILTGANGEVVDWSGTLASGQTLTIDMRNAIVEDQDGENRYDGLATAPRFWPIAPGNSQVSVQADNTDASSLILARWWPRRWAVV